MNRSPVRLTAAVFVAVVAASTIGAGGASAAPASADVAIRPAGFDCAVFVTNNGPDTARDVVVSSRDPFAWLRGHFPRHLGSIEPGGFRSVCFPLDYYLPKRTETYTVVSSTPDPDSSNNTSTN
ncbi:hypothetical protein [Williamsia maris]|uniref:Secreted protein n=1 Tax=Williamsia maris TaxID=72806 RepID=A0ABT1HJP7_9NOCA|nr:hypothetical protein [Williamsia maris]MCP2178172.1 hypothetical protein [Williamsia maris]